MGYKIWGKDSSGWYLAFDIIFDTKEKADEYILELNAKYNNKVKYGELLFSAYKEDIKLTKEGLIIDYKPFVKKRKFKRN